MRDTIIKLALTCAGISMFIGFFYAFGSITLKELGYTSSLPNTGVFLLLWLGPSCVAISIMGPFGLWYLWKSK